MRRIADRIQAWTALALLATLVVAGPALALDIGHQPNENLAFAALEERGTTRRFGRRLSGRRCLGGTAAIGAEGRRRHPFRLTLATGRGCRGNLRVDVPAG
jgi:hypothetical protein